MAMKHEAIFYKGIKFYRYPKSKFLTHRSYYRPSPWNMKKGFQALHQEIWKATNGKIPEGFSVHHKDHNPLNNKLSNLQLVNQKEHSSNHAKQRLSDKKVLAKQLKNLHSKKSKAKHQTWINSKEGKRVFKARWAKRKEFTIFCQVCQKPKTSKIVPQPRFCSGTCKTRNRNYRIETGKELFQWPKP